jgi:hypothetical protein
MSQKSSVPQAVSFVSQVLKRDNRYDEHFVVRVDGRVKSHHRRFLDALREGLQLRDQFPRHHVKVHSMQAGGRQRVGLH